MRRDSIAMLVLAALAGPVAADTIDATSTTVLSGRPDPRDGRVHTVVPITELVTLRAGQVKNGWIDDLTIVLRAWGEVDPGEPRDDRHATGDVDAAFVQGSTWKDRVRFRAGRQLVTGGAARTMPLDGVSGLVRPWRGLGVHVYGGAPVTPRFGVDRGDAAGGVRLSYQHKIDAEAGVSFAHVRDDGRLAREDLAFDGRWWPIARAGLSTFVLWSLAEERLAEADLAATVRVSRPLELGAGVRRTAPDLFVPRSSIFAVFSQERRDEAGAWLSWRRGSRARVNLDVRVLDSEAGRGQEGSLRGVVGLARGFESSLGGEARVLDLPSGGYAQARLYGTHQLGRIATTLDVDAYFLLEDVNGHDTSFTASATAGADVAPGWRLVVAGVAGATPFLEQRFEILAKLAWRATTRIREVRP